jgi:hypothetical protein
MVQKSVRKKKRKSGKAYRKKALSKLKRVARRRFKRARRSFY